MTSRSGLVLRFIGADLLGSVVWFPVWWYTTGLRRLGESIMRRLAYRSKEYALALWVKNFFVPMYGQYDLAGRAMSVFMRAVVIIFRSIALGCEALLWMVILTVWLAVLPTAVLFFIANLTRFAGFNAFSWFQ